MKHCTARLFLFAALSSALATGASVTVSGSVVDDGGKPVSHAQILINQAPTAAVKAFPAPPVVTGRLVTVVAADSSGNFSASSLPDGEYIVCAQAPDQPVLAPGFTVVDGHFTSDVAHIDMCNGARGHAVFTMFPIMEIDTRFD